MEIRTEQKQQLNNTKSATDIELNEVSAKDQLDASPNDASSLIAAFSKQEFYSGPVPLPSVLKAYEDVLPGLANRLVSMAENEQRIRKQDTYHYNWNVTLKIVLGFLGALALVAGGVYCTILGHPQVGVAIATSGILGGLLQSLIIRAYRKSDVSAGED